MLYETLYLFGGSFTVTIVSHYCKPIKFKFLAFNFQSRELFHGQKQNFPNLYLESFFMTGHKVKEAKIQQNACNLWHSGSKSIKGTFLYSS